MSSHQVTLRLAERADISMLAEIANAANAQSALHRRIAPHQDRYPLSYYQWRLNIMRQRFATPFLRTVLAQDRVSGRILGFASYAVEGENTALYKRWVGESSWADWLEDLLVGLEKTWCEYTDRSVDYRFVKRFVAAFMGSDKSARPPCLHCHQIAVDPSTQSRGVGAMLIDWAKELVVQEDLPLYLESNLEATRFYEKGGFSRLGQDLVLDFDAQEPMRVPVFVWEGHQRQGRWLELIDGGATWRWRNDILPPKS